MEKYVPPFTISNKMLQLVSSISEKIDFGLDDIIEQLRRAGVESSENDLSGYFCIITSE